MGRECSFQPAKCEPDWGAEWLGGAVLRHVGRIEFIGSCAGKITILCYNNANNLCHHEYVLPTVLRQLGSAKRVLGVGDCPGHC